VAELKALFKPLMESARDLAPIVIVIVFFQTVILHQPFPHVERMISGIILILTGLALFVRGLEIGLFPVGEAMAHAFVGKGSVFWLLLFAFALGFGTTVAEPALIAIAGKAAEVAAKDGMIQLSHEAMQSYALGVLRILLNWPLHWCIMIGYMLVVGVTMVTPHELVGIAYDSGGVTTSAITVPMVTALGIGLASSIRGRNPILDGFGLIAFASLLPVLFVMVYGIWVIA